MSTAVTKPAGALPAGTRPRLRFGLIGLGLMGREMACARAYQVAQFNNRLTGASPYTRALC